MKVEFVVNGGVVAVMCPENAMEEELLKALAKQTNEIIQVRTPVNVLAKTIRGSILICRKESLTALQEPPSPVLLDPSETNKDEKKK